jgi:hypothetical protein
MPSNAQNIFKNVYPFYHGRSHLSLANLAVPHDMLTRSFYGEFGAKKNPITSERLASLAASRLK